MAFPIENLLSPNLTNMLITLVIPFLLIFTVLLFVLKRTNVFGPSAFVYVFISLGMTVMIYAVNPGGVFQFLASYLFQIGVMGSIIAFVMILFVFLWTFVKGGIKVAESLKGPQQQLKDLEKDEKKLMNKYYSHGLFGASTAEREQIAQKLTGIERQKKFLLAKLRRLE